jgi:hypothetical protein
MALLWQPPDGCTVDIPRLLIEWACLAVAGGAVWFCTSKPK